MRLDDGERLLRCRTSRSYAETFSSGVRSPTPGEPAADHRGNCPIRSATEPAPAIILPPLGHRRETRSHHLLNAEGSAAHQTPCAEEGRGMAELAISIARITSRRGVFSVPPSTLSARPRSAVHPQLDDTENEDG